MRDPPDAPYRFVMRASSRAGLAPLVLAVLALAGCGGGGGGKSPAESLADCLNGQGWDVTANGDSVSGTSTGGTEFTATLKDDKLTIDDSANGPGQGLADQERTNIQLCTDERFKSRSG